MGQASLATFYLVFAILTIYLNLESIGIGDANAIYRTVSAAFMQYPFPVASSTKYLNDVQDPEEVRSWLAYSLKPVLFGEQENMTTNAWGDTTWNHTLTPATVGSFNRILLVRFTFKRWAVENTGGVFARSTPHRIVGGSSKLNYWDQYHIENKDTICPTGTTNFNAATCFRWQTAQSFDEAGGYTEFFDPMEGVDAYNALLDKMSRAGMFDQLMATCTIDMIVYNANVDMFLQYIQAFQFDFCGYAQLSNYARSFNLDVFNTSMTQYLVLYVMRVACIVMVVIFGLIEVHRMWELGFFAALHQKGAVTDMVSITVSFGVLLSYWTIEQMPPFKDFQFEALQNAKTRANTYVSLCDVARSLELQALFVALNLLVVSLRTVSLVSGLHSNLGLILKVIDVSAPNFVAFMVLFGMLQAGFVLASFFAFGAGYSDMSDIWLCIYKSFSMLTGDMVFHEITRVDNILGPIYFFAFYILFYLVLINIFVTLLMSGYDVVDYELKKKGEEDCEKNPLSLIFEELKADVVGTTIRYGGSLLKHSRVCLDPILESFKAIFICSPPSFFMDRCRRKRTLRSVTHAESSMLPTSSHADDEVSGKLRKKIVPCITMLGFMAVWTSLVTLQSRGPESYLTGQATLMNSALDKMFYKGNEMKAFDQINTFSDVKTWADTAIVGLYDSPVCAENSANGATWASSSGCSSSSESHQLLNRIANWNIGFLNTTFVRLTIQPACFAATAEKWASGSPTVRKTPDVQCWNSVCTDVLTAESCRSADGQILNAQTLANAINQTFLADTIRFGYEPPGNHLGPFRTLGGVAVSLGLTKDQCQDMLALLDDSKWFTKNSASLVFDWLTYNGNIDLFTHNVVAFSLLETGFLQRSSESRTFPLNVEAGGGHFDQQILVLVLFGIYLLLLLYHIGEKCIRLRRMYVKCCQQLQQPFKKFVTEVLLEWWNVVDLISLLVSIATFTSFMLFVLNSFRMQYRFSTGSHGDYMVPNDDVEYFDMEQVVNPERYLEDDWYIFKEFEAVQDYYMIFLQLAALNSFWTGFKAIRTVSVFKFVNTFSKTLNSGKRRNIYFIIVINLQMFGFALAMTVIFGTTVQEFSSPLATMGSLLYWVCGTSKLDHLLTVRPIVAILFFAAFTVVFRFISTNMFLATQLNTFAALAGELDIRKAKKVANEKMGLKQVKYCNRREVITELDLELKGEQVVVKKVRPGKAAMTNITPGCVVSKVNKEKLELKAILDAGEQEHVERALMPGEDGCITIVFQDPPKQSMLGRLNSFVSSSCKKCFRCRRKKVKPTQKLREEAYAKPPALRPSVRNFWRFHGAISEVKKESQVSGDGEASGSNEPSSTPTCQDVAHKLCDPRAEVRKRLHKYLFSRWPGSSSSVDLDSLMGDDGYVLAEDILHEGWDVDELTEVMKEIPVTGQEVWLDCLFVALEEEMFEESTIVEVLRTAHLKEVSQIRRLNGPSFERLLRFYQRLDKVLKVLENKARTQYFLHLQRESEERQDLIAQQNEVLHDYVCELEREFSNVSGEIKSYQGKKEVMLTKMSSVLDPEYLYFQPRRRSR